MSLRPGSAWCSRCLQPVQVPVGKPGQSGARELDAVIDAGVVEPVAKHRVPRPHEGADHPQVGHVAGAEDDRRRRSFKGRQLLFHLPVQGQVPGHQAGGAGSHPPPGRGGTGGVDEARVYGQAQIVVGGQVQQHPAVHAHPAPRKHFLHFGEPPAEAPGGQVLQFLVQVFKHD